MDNTYNLQLRHQGQTHSLKTREEVDNYIKVHLADGITLLPYEPVLLFYGEDDEKKAVILVGLPEGETNSSNSYFVIDTAELYERIVAGEEEDVRLSNLISKNTDQINGLNAKLTITSEDLEGVIKACGLVYDEQNKPRVSYKADEDDNIIRKASNIADAIDKISKFVYKISQDLKLNIKNDENDKSLVLSLDEDKNTLSGVVNIATKSDLSEKEFDNNILGKITNGLYASVSLGINGDEITLLSSGYDDNDEFKVDVNKHTITLPTYEGNDGESTGITVSIDENKEISAKLNLSTDADNILNLTNGIYSVKGTSDNIKHDDSTVEATLKALESRSISGGTTQTSVVTVEDKNNNGQVTITNNVRIAKDEGIEVVADKGLSIQKSLSETLESAKTYTGAYVGKLSLELVSSDNELEYGLYYENTKIGNSINIPKDQYVKDAVYDSEDRKIILTLEGRKGDIKVSFSVADLVNIYTAGKGLTLLDDEFSVDLSTNTESVKYLRLDGHNAIEVYGIDSAISNAINNLDYADTEVANQYVSAVSETNGQISVIHQPLPIISVSSPENESYLDVKTDANGNVSISTKGISDISDSTDTKITNAIKNLSFTDKAEDKKYVSAVSESYGVISVERADLPIVKVVKADNDEHINVTTEDSIAKIKTEDIASAKTVEGISSKVDSVTIKKDEDKKNYYLSVDNEQKGAEIPYYEFGQGLTTDNKKIVSVKLNEDSDDFISLSDEGIKVYGINDAIDNAIRDLKGNITDSSTIIVTKNDTGEISAQVQVSKTGGNIINATEDGIYAKVTLTYDNDTNTLTFNNGGEEESLVLSTHTTLDGGEYDSQAENITITDSTGKNIGINVKDLVHNIQVKEKTPSAISLSVDDATSGISKISAQLKLVADDNAATITDNDLLYVSKKAEDYTVTYGKDHETLSLQDAITDIEQVNTNNTTEIMTLKGDASTTGSVDNKVANALTNYKVKDATQGTTEHVTVEISDTGTLSVKGDDIASATQLNNIDLTYEKATNTLTYKDANGSVHQFVLYGASIIKSGIYDNDKKEIYLTLNTVSGDEQTITIGVADLVTSLSWKTTDSNSVSLTKTEDNPNTLTANVKIASSVDDQAIVVNEDGLSVSKNLKNYNVEYGSEGTISGQLAISKLKEAVDKMTDTTALQQRIADLESTVQELKEQLESLVDAGLF